MADSNMTNILAQELAALEGIQSQHPETGAGVGSGSSYLSQYTNRIFGAPFQLLDSVDRRFEEVNSHVGNEYLRNFILNSPILHIKPGMPKYTGGAEGNSLVDSIKEIYLDSASGNMTHVQSLLTELASNTIFSKGSKLQKRMFGFRETYYNYMSHVNYMCRSMATFLNLTDTSLYPNGTYINGTNELQPFSSMKWEDYRMLTSSVATSPFDELKKMASSTLLGAAFKSVGDVIDGATVWSASVANSVIDAVKELGDNPTGVASAVSGTLFGASSVFDDLKKTVGENTANIANSVLNSVTDNFSYALNNNVVDVTIDKISSVLFMVEPGSFSESLTNETSDSAIESAIDAINDGIGYELAFITGSKVDLGLIEGVTNFLGSSVDSMAGMVEKLLEPIGGGFASNLFSGAVRSLKGQKMIYPKIYKKSNSEMNYTFNINLTSPYGDVYNYYMNIVVPLMHLIALAAPRLVSANSVASPFLVQAFIPGMCTCQLGIVQSLRIEKNPSQKHVSVNGYPLDIKVEMQIEELYNAMSISPANDPASFLFNETLNDYMANLAGLQPSVDTYTKQRQVAFQGLEEYFTSGEMLNDIVSPLVYKIEENVNPYIKSGS